MARAKRQMARASKANCLIALGYFGPCDRDYIGDEIVEPSYDILKFKKKNVKKMKKLILFVTFSHFISFCKTSL